LDKTSKESTTRKRRERKDLRRRASKIPKEMPRGREKSSLSLLENKRGKFPLFLIILLEMNFTSEGEALELLAKTRPKKRCRSLRQSILRITQFKMHSIIKKTVALIFNNSLMASPTK
jgi:hypothetical protein